MLDTKERFNLFLEVVEQASEQAYCNVVDRYIEKYHDAPWALPDNSPFWREPIHLDILWFVDKVNGGKA